MSLLFLRPLPPPSKTTILTFSRNIANVRTPSRRATGGGPARHSKPVRQTWPHGPQAAIQTTPSTSPSTPDTTATTPTTLADLEPLAYYVGRTPSQQLPIYHAARRGGSLHQTLVKKIQGDIKALKEELQDTLNLEDKHITINHLNNSIIIKGWVKSEIAEFLRARHF